jgi:hypothetical protein
MIELTVQELGSVCLICLELIIIASLLSCLCYIVLNAMLILKTVIAKFKQVKS